MISQHPGISKVVVVGIPDIRLTERVVACLNIKDGWKWVDQKTKHSPDGKQVSPQMLQDHCSRRKLSRFQSSFPLKFLESKLSKKKKYNGR